MADPAGYEGFLTVDEYLAREERASVRHEYVAGVVYAMTGGTARHNLLAGNIFVKLRAAAAGGPCRVFINDMKVRAAEDVFYYPDLFVSCQPLDDSVVYLREPCLVVEVLSPSSALTDRREKLLAYRAIPTLRAYLVVEQRWRRVEVHTRIATGEWRHEQLSGQGVVAIPCPATTLALDAIYEGLSVPTIGEPASTYDAADATA